METQATIVVNMTQKSTEETALKQQSKQTTAQTNPNT